jgi:hypothetical protein
LFLLTRIFVLVGLVCVLYYGLGYFGLTGMVTTAVGALLIEKAIAETMVIRKLGLGLRHVPLLKNVAKTAVISILAGIVTYFVYSNAHTYLLDLGRRVAAQVFLATREGTLDFVGGGFVLLVSLLVFAPIYLLAANFWGVIENEEKNQVKNFVRKFMPRRTSSPVVETQV